MDSKIDQRFANASKSQTFLNKVRLFDLDKKSVLDIGCCNGEALVHFGPGSTGLTINPEEVAVGKERGLDIRLGNIEATDCTGNLDLTTSGGNLRLSKLNGTIEASTSRCASLVAAPDLAMSRRRLSTYLPSAATRFS